MGVTKAFLFVASALAACVCLHAAEPEAVYTAEQAAVGRTAYESSCAACHTDSLIPAADAVYKGQRIPPLAGTSFLARWGARNTQELSSRIRDAIGGFPPKDLREDTFLALTAYVLQSNGARPGPQELKEETAVAWRTASEGPHDETQPLR
ncbi:MAG: hypothetical protein GC160_09295 [Acidobacteria bacterium]|nr:hypothetical protein [Acidobacteriota bacterium]